MGGFGRFRIKGGKKLGVGGPTVVLSKHRNTFLKHLYRISRICFFEPSHHSHFLFNPLRFWLDQTYPYTTLHVHFLITCHTQKYETNWLRPKLQTPRAVKLDVQGQGQGFGVLLVFLTIFFLFFFFWIGTKSLHDKDIPHPLFSGSISRPKWLFLLLIFHLCPPQFLCLQF